MPRLWLISGVVVALSIVAAASWPVQQPSESPRQDSSSGSAGPVTESVIGSWEAHGANDGPIAEMPRLPVPLEPAAARGGQSVPAPPEVAALAPTLMPQGWIIDLVVLWRWPGRAPEMTGTWDMTGVGGQSGLGRAVHRIVVEGGRTLQVDHDPRAGTFEVLGGESRPLNGANVLLLDVTPSGVSVAGLVYVEPRYASDEDPFQAAIARSPVVADFVNR